MDASLIEIIAQMTDIIKKQQETIDKLTTKDVQYIHIEKISTEDLNKRLNEAPTVPYKTTGVNEQKDVAISCKPMTKLGPNYWKVVLNEGEYYE